MRKCSTAGKGTTRTEADEYTKGLPLRISETAASCFPVAQGRATGQKFSIPIAPHHGAMRATQPAQMICVKNYVVV